MITRYDGTRFITETEIDKEFTDHWVLIAIENDQQGFDGEGYLIASIEDVGDNYGLIADLATELDFKVKIKCGCKERGGDLHVQILS